MLIFLGLFCSCLTTEILRVLCPTLSFTSGELAKIPFIIITSKEVAKSIYLLISLEKRDWDSCETSWDFTSPPLLYSDCQQPTLKATCQKLITHWRKMALDVQQLEEENNRIFIEAYGLKDEMTPEVPLDEITLTCNPHYRYGNNKIEAELETLLQNDTMKEFVSYAIGCMMGRYSIDAKGLVFAGGDWNRRWEQYKARREEMEERRQRDVASEELLAREEPYEIPEGCESWAHSPSFPEDDDGIIPILEEDYFPDDCTSRLIEFLKVTFGEEKLNENLQFLAENLHNTKRDESPTQVIRRYLSTQFYKDHIKTYKKRPIYWLFTSGKERAFQALIYMHRYTPSMLAKMRTDYLHELQGKIEIRARHLREVATSGSPKEKIKADKELSKIHKQQGELRHYDELLRNYADKRIEIDLDDGVKVNYQKFEGLVETIPGLKKKEK